MEDVRMRRMWEGGCGKANRRHIKKAWSKEQRKQIRDLFPFSCTHTKVIKIPYNGRIKGVMRQPLTVFLGGTEANLEY